MIARVLGLLTITIVVYGLLPAPSYSDEYSDKLAIAVESAFRPLLQAHDVPGIAVAVTVNGRRQYFSYGIASKESNAPVTEDTLFEIGSVSKTFTATLGAYAQALGWMSLEDHPSKYMPQLHGRAIDQANLLHLGTYTAGGLPLQFPAAVADHARMVTFLQQWKPSAPPGAQRRYSNPSIGVFGHIAALAMNGDFADLMQSQLRRKLGLNHTHIRVPKAEMGKYAWGYKSGKPIRAAPAVFDAEAYGVKSSAADMIRYVEINIDPRSLEPRLRRAVESTQVGYFKVGEMVQGLGWEQYAWPLALEQLLTGNSDRMVFEANAATALSPPLAPSVPTLYNKTGSTSGFGAYVAFVPAKRIGIVMLANTNFPISARITAAHAVLEVLAAGAP